MKANKELIATAKIGDTKAMEEALKNGAEINYKEKSFSSLLWAAYNGHTKAVKFLVDRHASHIPDQNINTALHCAARNGHKETVKYLIRETFLSNEKNRFDQTAADVARIASETASGKQQIELAKQLKETEALIINETLLHGIRSGWETEIIEKDLLQPRDPKKYGENQILASVNYENELGETPLLVAIYEQQPEITKFLFSKKVKLTSKQLKAASVKLNTLAHNFTDDKAKWIDETLSYLVNEALISIVQQADEKDLKEIEELIQFAKTNKIKTVQYTGQDGLSALHWAITLGKVEIVKCFFNLIKTRDELILTIKDAEEYIKILGNAPGCSKEIIAFLKSYDLILAARSGDIKTIDECLKAGADINLQPTVNFVINNHPAWTKVAAIHHAAGDSSTAVVAHLHKNGAKLNLKDSYGDTPLLWAAFAGKISTLHYLLSHGSHLKEFGTQGKSALFWAANEENIPEMEFLLRRGAYIDVITNDGINIHAAMHQKNANHSSLPLLAAAKKLIDTADDEKAIDEAFRETLKTLKTNVNARRMIDGNTALRIALKKDTNIALITTLFCSGANVDLPNDTQDTVFKYAERSEKPLYLSLAHLARINTLIQEYNDVLKFHNNKDYVLDEKDLIEYKTSMKKQIADQVTRTIDSIDAIFKEEFEDLRIHEENQTLSKELSTLEALWHAEKIIIPDVKALDAMDEKTRLETIKEYDKKHLEQGKRIDERNKDIERIKKAIEENTKKLQENKKYHDEKNYFRLILGELLFYQGAEIVSDPVRAYNILSQVSNVGNNAFAGRSNLFQRAQGYCYDLINMNYIDFRSLGLEDDAKPEPVVFDPFDAAEGLKERKKRMIEHGQLSERDSIPFEDLFLGYAINNSAANNAASKIDKKNKFEKLTATSFLPLLDTIKSEIEKEKQEDTEKLQQHAFAESQLLEQQNQLVDKQNGLKARLLQLKKERDLFTQKIQTIKEKQKKEKEEHDKKMAADNKANAAKKAIVFSIAASSAASASATAAADPSETAAAAVVPPLSVGDGSITDPILTEIPVVPLIPETSDTPSPKSSNS